ncbi:UNVERIFIED_CONTAM: hypothetical protein GTU68_036776 [Idotea baltica]|nr:hypothetical protein [Idotea baltica]
MPSSTYQHRARKRFGQNFLHDTQVIDGILKAINPTKSDHLIEIGPGQGAITQGLITSEASLDAIELDYDLIAILKDKFAKYPNFKLHQGDTLKFDFSQLSCQSHDLRIIGNLPYNISTPLIFHLLTYITRLKDMHFMLQKEVVERLSAQPGSKSWGRLSIMVQYFCRVEHLFNVSPHSFNPAPKVQSAIVRLTPHKELPHLVDNTEIFKIVVREAFNQRRKTLRNTLKKLLSAEDIASVNVDSSLRPEQLDLATYVKLANKVNQLMIANPELHAFASR